MVSQSSPLEMRHPLYPEAFRALSYKTVCPPFTHNPFNVTSALHPLGEVQSFRWACLLGLDPTPLGSIGVKYQWSCLHTDRLIDRDLRVIRDAAGGEQP